MQPERTIELTDGQGGVRIRLVAQVWQLRGQAYVTSFSLAVMGPHDFTDADCSWLAEQFKELLRQE